MPTLPGKWIWPGMIPILHCPGVITPGQLGPIKRTQFITLHFRVQHVQRGNAFCNTDDQLDARIGRFRIESLQNGAGT